MQSNDWLDYQQAKELVADMAQSTFYTLAAKVTQNRAPHKIPRTSIETRKGRPIAVQRNVLVWTLDEVLEVERLAVAKNLIKTAGSEPAPPDPVELCPGKVYAAIQELVGQDAEHWKARAEEAEKQLAKAEVQLEEHRALNAKLNRRLAKLNALQDTLAAVLSDH